MSKYFVFIETQSERACPYFDSLDEAVAKYNSVEMKVLRDNVCLGIQSDNITTTSGYCFDVIHKFFNANILINDYLNHDEDEIAGIVEQIRNKLPIRYQYTSDILDGVLIDYFNHYSPYSGEVKKEWNEVYLYTYKDEQMTTIGWVKPTRETYDSYGWNYPVTASYISIINVDVIDDNGVVHSIDINPGAYLQMIGKKISIIEE